MKTYTTLTLASALALGLGACGEKAGETYEAASADETASAEVHNQLTDAEKAAGWKLLFDGKNVEGWHGYNDDPIGPEWQAVDGALTMVEGGGGNLLTVDQYRNFDFKWEWRLSDEGNSGVMFHIQEGDEPAPYWTGPEYQIVDNSRGEKPEHQAGSLYGLHVRAKDVTKPIGEWNSSRMKIMDGKVTFWMNGEIMVEDDMNSASMKERIANSKFGKWPRFGATGVGYIGLQDHGDWVAYRNLKILDLGD